MLNDKTQVVYYEDIYYKVQYDIGYNIIEFKAWELEYINPDCIEDSPHADKDCNMSGWVAGNDCCEFNYSTHLCDLEDAKVFYKLMVYIYQFKNQTFNLC